MQKAEIIEAMARAIFEAVWDRDDFPFEKLKASTSDRHIFEHTRCMEEAHAALSALTSTIPGGEAALIALLSGEAVILAKAQRRELFDAGVQQGSDEATAFLHGKEPETGADAAYREALREIERSTPYAAKEGRDG